MALLRTTRGRLGGAALACVLIAQHALAKESGPVSSVRGLPRSGQRFWLRVADPARDRTARLRVLVERLVAKARAAQDDPQVARRLYESIGAIATVSGVALESSGELGFLVGHALLHADDGNEERAQTWIESALRQCPASYLAFTAWTDLAQLHARSGDSGAVFGALDRAAPLATSPIELAEVYRLRAFAYERIGDFEHARSEYVRWSMLEVDENSLAEAGWRLAVALDVQGEHEAAVHEIDKAEARAYTLDPRGLTAIDSTKTPWSSDRLATYAQGVMYRWLALRREVPPTAESNRRALAAFGAVVMWRDTAHSAAAKWHLDALRRKVPKRGVVARE